MHIFICDGHVVSGDNYTINSVLYRWDEEDLVFQPVQNITTVGAYDWTHFAVDGYHLLAVANSFTAQPSPRTRLDSVIYFWEDGRFLPFQNIEVSISIPHKISTMRVDVFLHSFSLLLNFWL